MFNVNKKSIALKLDEGVFVSRGGFTCLPATPDEAYLKLLIYLREIKVFGKGKLTVCDNLRRFCKIENRSNKIVNEINEIKLI